MNWLFKAILFIGAIEIFFGFVVSAVKNKRVHYAIKLTSIYVFNNILGYKPRNNMRYSRQQGPFPNMPKKIFNFDLRTNDVGFFSTRPSSSLSGTKWIACVGGSTTMGAESSYEMTFPNQLDSLMGPSVTVVNCGVGGYRSVQESLWMKHYIARFRPAAIILYSGFNDFERSINRFTREEANDPFNHHFPDHLHRTRLRNIIDCSAVLHYLLRRKRIKVHDGKSMRYHAHKWEKQFYKTTLDTIEFCHSINCKVFLLNHVSPCCTDASGDLIEKTRTTLDIHPTFYPIYAGFPKAANKILAGLARKTGATVIDWNTAYQAHITQSGTTRYDLIFDYFVDRCHYSPEANTLIAQCIHESLGKTFGTPSA